MKIAVAAHRREDAESRKASSRPSSLEHERAADSNLESLISVWFASHTSSLTVDANTENSSISRRPSYFWSTCRQRMFGHADTTCLQSVASNSFTSANLSCEPRLRSRSSYRFQSACISALKTERFPNCTTLDGLQGWSDSTQQIV